MHSSWLTGLSRLGPPVFTICLVLGLSGATARLRLAQGLSTWFCFFIPGQILLNWLQFLRNQSFVPVATENYPGYVHRYPTLWYSNSRHDREGGDISRQAAASFKASYKDCLSCDMHVPNRSHHCPHCRKCIYILDHHCFFLGHCVGRKNLKYFLVFCLYASVGCAVGIYHIMMVLKDQRKIVSRDSIFYFLPFSIVMYCVNRAPMIETIYVGLVNFGIGACLMSAFLFFYGIYRVMRGTTPYENRRHLKGRESHLSVTERFQAVFGSYGLLHFFWPILPCQDSPCMEPGYRMLLGHHYA